MNFNLLVLSRNDIIGFVIITQTVVSNVVACILVRTGIKVLEHILSLPHAILQVFQLTSQARTIGLRRMSACIMASVLGIVATDVLFIFTLVADSAVSSLGAIIIMVLSLIGNLWESFWQILAFRAAPTASASHSAADVEVHGKP